MTTEKLTDHAEDPVQLLVRGAVGGDEVEDIPDRSHQDAVFLGKVGEFSPCRCYILMQ